MPLVSFVLLSQVYEPSLNFNILTIANCVSTIVINNGVKNLCLHWFCLGKKSWSQANYWDAQLWKKGWQAAKTTSFYKTVGCMGQKQALITFCAQWS